MYDEARRRRPGPAERLETSENFKKITISLYIPCFSIAVDATQEKKKGEARGIKAAPIREKDTHKAFRIANITSLVHFSFSFFLLASSPLTLFFLPFEREENGGKGAGPKKAG